ncbi:LPXTG cell wall anchor domain-containing protein [Actinoplanes sp. NPDC089786]|uniref:LPXTG cell wall anchor domain-containing protein n=1 Tax=Actinoplanes sp. NPDC089786 TaxID=3155185 RepID=UPI0034463EAC
MSLTRRLTAGLPAVGVTALAALAFAGSPAYATGDGSARAGQPAVMATPCSSDERTKCDSSADSDGYGGGAAAATTAVPNDNATAGGNDDDRGNKGYGYGSESPTPSPSETTPSGGTDTVPPGGELPETVPPTAPGTTPPTGGVNAGTLPLTGAPMGATIGLGALLVAGGAAAVWYTRRRREA